MAWLNFLGWFLLNVGVPLLAPLALLPLLGAGRQHRGKVGMLIKWSVQDGQLFWPIIAMCVAACYEAAGMLSTTAAKQNAYGPAMAWTIIAWHVLIIVASSVLVSVSTTDATVKHHNAREDTLSPVVLISIAGSVITAVTYPTTHFLAG